MENTKSSQNVIVDSILNISVDGIFVFDKKKNIVFWNTEMEKITGMHKEACLGSHIFDVLPWLHYPENQAYINTAINGGKALGKQFYLHPSSTFSGGYYQASFSSASPGTEHSGMVMVILRLLNDKPEVPKAMSEEAFRFKQLFQSDAIALGIFDTEGNWIYANSAYIGILGKSEEQRTSPTYNLFQDKQLLDQDVMPYLKRSISGEVTQLSAIHYLCQNRAVQAGDNGKYFSGYIFPLKDKQGQVSEIAVVLSEVAVENQTGFVTKSFYRKLRKLTSNLPAVIYEYIKTPGGTDYFPYISDGCLDILGFPAEKAMENPEMMEGVIHPGDLVGFKDSAVIADRNFSDWEWEGRAIVNGTVKWLKGVSSPEQEGNGVIARYGILIDITDRKIAESKHREMEQRLDLAVNGADIGFWDWNITTGDSIISDRWITRIGYDPKTFKLTTASWDSFIHPDDLPVAKRKIAEHLKGEVEFYENEYRFKSGFGNWIWMLDRGKVVERDKDGVALRAAGTHLDISERKHAEKVLQQSEERYRKLIDHSPFAIVVHFQGEILFANPASARLLGAEKGSDLEGLKVMDFIHQDFKKEVADRMKKVASGISVPTMSQKLVRIDGTSVDVEIVGIPFEYNGQSAVQVVIRDISEERKAQAIIKKNELLFSQLFHGTPIGIVLLDEHHMVIQINAGFESIFGYEESEIKGKSLNGLIVPESLKKESHDINEFTKSGKVGSLQTIRIDKHGNQVAVIVYGVPVQLNNQTIGIYGIYVDITERIKVEEELKIRNSELDNFVYKVSHDLRAPLSSILGLIYLAKHEHNEDDVHQYVDMVESRVKELDRFIGDVLSHSKNLKIEVTNAKVEFEKIITECFDDLNYLPNAERISKSVTIEGEEFYNDKWRINEIFRNLISNTIKYIDPDKTKPQVAIKVKVSMTQASISFTDNGIGISEENLPKIFEMFYRATENSDGSGIGLYIVRNAVEKIGGTIRIQSKFGEGTTFHIIIPNRQKAFLES